jgi:hypothetical protein
MRIPFPVLFPLAVLTAAPLSAQVVNGGDLVVTNFGSPAAVFRVDAGGNVLTVLSGAPLSGPAGLTMANNRDVIVADFNSSTLVRINAITGAPIVFASSLGGPLRVCKAGDRDYAVTSNTSRAVLRVTPSGVVTTIASGPPLNRPFGVAADVDGNLLVADDLGRAVYRVTPAGAVTPIHSGLPLQLPQGVALFPNGDYAVIDGVADAIFRIDRATNAITTWVSAGALGVNPEGIVTDWSGGFFVAHSGNPGGPGIRAIDAAGNAAAVPTLAPAWTNLEDVALVPVVSGPGILNTGPGGQFVHNLDAPRAGGDFYTLILSTSVLPGWSFPAGDPRALFLNVDPFFLATIGQNAPPFLVGWAGFLSPGGSAVATTDLTALPAGLLTGLVLHLQGITMNGLSIRDATNLRRLEFQ